MKKYFKLITQKTLRIPIVSRILRFFNPDFSYCQKCGLPWNWCKIKSVNWHGNSGTFATCDVCWNNSTFSELKKYYTDTYTMQASNMHRIGRKMDHTLEHLLKCVEEEYLRTHKV